MLIPASLYYTVYLIIVTIFTLWLYFKYLYYDETRECESPSMDITCLIITIIFILYIGFRPISEKFGDMSFYSDIYTFLYNRGRIVGSHDGFCGDGCCYSDSCDCGICRVYTYAATLERSRGQARGDAAATDI